MINDPVQYDTCDSSDTSGATITDRGSGGNNGTLVNGPTSTTGKIAQALSFNGTSQYVTSGQPITGYPFSLACWFYPTDNSRGQTIFAICNSVGGSTAGRYLLYFLSGSLFLFAQDASANIFLQAVGSVTLNAWNHAVGVFNSSTDFKVYLNDGTPGSGTTSVLFVLPTAVQAAVDADAANYFSGGLDELRVYDRAISSSDVTDLYNFTGATNPLFRRSRSLRAGSRSAA